MNAEAGSSKAGVERIKVIVAMAALAVGIIAFYLLAGEPMLYRMGALLAGIVIALIFAWFSSRGKEFLYFARDSWREVQKVVWPSRRETLQMTGAVFAFVIVVALFLWLSDKTLEFLLYDLILGWR